MAIQRMYREDHDQPREEVMTREQNGRISTLINQALKLTHIIDGQVGSLSEQLQPITRPSMPSLEGDLSETTLNTVNEPDHRESPMAEQISLLIHQLQRLSSRISDLPERLDI